MREALVYIGAGWGRGAPSPTFGLRAVRYAIELRAHMGPSAQARGPHAWISKMLLWLVAAPLGPALTPLKYPISPKALSGLSPADPGPHVRRLNAGMALAHRLDLVELAHPPARGLGQARPPSGGTYARHRRVVSAARGQEADALSAPTYLGPTAY